MLFCLRGMDYYDEYYTGNDIRCDDDTTCIAFANVTYISIYIYMYNLLETMVGMAICVYPDVSLFC